MFSRYVRPVPEASIELDSLSDLQKKSIDIIIEMNKLIISLSLIVLGALGGFLIQKYQVVKIKSLMGKLIIVLSIFFSALSIYFGYVIYSRMVEMLSNKMFNPASNLIELSQKFQYYSFLSSLILFGLFVINAATNETGGKSDDAKS